MHAGILEHGEQVAYSGDAVEELLVSRGSFGEVARLLEDELEVEAGGLHPMLLELVHPVQAADHLRRTAAGGGR